MKNNSKKKTSNFGVFLCMQMLCNSNANAMQVHKVCYANAMQNYAN